MTYQNGDPAMGSVLLDAAIVLDALVSYPVEYEYPGYISIVLDDGARVSVGDNGDVGERLGFEVDDGGGERVGNIVDAFEIEAVVTDTPEKIACAVVDALSRIGR